MNVSGCGKSQSSVVTTEGLLYVRVRGLTSPSPRTSLPLVHGVRLIPWLRVVFQENVPPSSDLSICASIAFHLWESNPHRSFENKTNQIFCPSIMWSPFWFSVSSFETHVCIDFVIPKWCLLSGICTWPSHSTWCKTGIAGSIYCRWIMGIF